MVVLDNVVKCYGDNVAIDGINLEVREGEFVFVIGRSGAGKTTLIRLLMRELTADFGELEVNGIDLNQLSPRNLYRYRRFIGVVFQDFRLLYDRNVYENVAFAQRVIEVPPHRIPERVHGVLRQVGLEEKALKYPNELSEGEKQRVALARAVVNRPCLLLADEPTKNLDRANAIHVMRLIEEINQKGTTVVVSSHNREIVNAMRKRVITLEKGKIINDSIRGRYFYGLDEE